MSRTPVAASGWPQAIAPPYGIEARVVGCDADAVAPGQHLHRERLVELEEPDVVDREALALEDPLRRRDRPEAHQVRLDAGVGEPDEPHLRLEAELRGRRPRRRAGTRWRRP